MSLFLIESVPPRSHGRDEVRQALDRIAEEARVAGGDLLEVQVAEDLSKVYAIVEAGDPEAAKQAFRAGGLPVSLIKQVRLVGQDVEAARRSRGRVDYVVEWNFPPGLTMEAYLQRKQASAPKYAEVPEVRFLRTYVCEDMTKCICFYDADQLAGVLRARQVVGAPVDAVTRVVPAGEEDTPAGSAAGSAGGSAAGRGPGSAVGEGR